MSIRILFCVESVAVREAINKSLPKQRMELVPVSNPDLARYLLDLVHPALVLAALPGETGHELNQFIREDPKYRHIPVVVLVAHSSSLDQVAEACTLVDTIDTLLQDEGENRTVFLSSESLAGLSTADALATSEATRLVVADTSRSDTSVLTTREPPGFNAIERQAEMLKESASTTKAVSGAMLQTGGEEKALAIIAPVNALEVPSQPRQGPRRVRWAVAALCLLVVIALALYQVTRVKQPRRDEALTTEEPSGDPSDAGQLPPYGKTDIDTRLKPAVPEAQLQDSEHQTSSIASGRAQLAPAASRALFRTRKPAAAVTPPRILEKRTPGAEQNAAPKSSQPIEIENRANGAESRGAGGSLTGTKNKSTTPGSEMRKAAGELKQAGEHAASGLKHFGIGTKDAVVWSGKTVGRAFKNLGRGIKKAFAG